MMKTAVIQAKYFESLLNSEAPNLNFTFEVKDQVIEDSTPPTAKEVGDIIEQLKSNKSSGEDVIISELYRGISILPTTYKIFSKAFPTRCEEQLHQKLGEYRVGVYR